MLLCLPCTHMYCTCTATYCMLHPTNWLLILPRNNGQVPVLSVCASIIFASTRAHTHTHTHLSEPLGTGTRVANLSHEQNLELNPLDRLHNWTWLCAKGVCVCVSSQPFWLIPRGPLDPVIVRYSAIYSWSLRIPEPSLAFPFLDKFFTKQF